MEDLSLHILDISENCITAGADLINISINEDVKNNCLEIVISDNGSGMDEDMLNNAKNPFHTTRTTRDVGLGIPLLSQAAQECGGTMSISSKKGSGTSIRATFQYDHIDRKPMGNIADTMIVLIAGNPDVDFVLIHKRGDKSYRLDTSEIKKEIEGLAINNPEIIKIIREDINSWLNLNDNMIQ